jgi:hypothetical protein
VRKLREIAAERQIHGQSALSPTLDGSVSRVHGQIRRMQEFERSLIVHQTPRAEDKYRVCREIALARGPSEGHV